MVVPSLSPLLVRPHPPPPAARADDVLQERPRVRSPPPPSLVGQTHCKALPRPHCRALDRETPTAHCTGSEPLQQPAKGLGMPRTTDEWHLVLRRPWPCVTLPPSDGTGSAFQTPRSWERLCVGHRRRRRGRDAAAARVSSGTTVPLPSRRMNCSTCPGC